MISTCGPTENIFSPFFPSSSILKQSVMPAISHTTVLRQTRSANLTRSSLGIVEPSCVMHQYGI